MTVHVTGNARIKLNDLRRKLTSAPELLGVIAQNLAEEAVELVRQGFEKEEDPYGEDWEPLKAREGKILQDTGALRNSWHTVDVSRRGFTVAPAVDYATYHQTGTKRGLPQRMMVPEKELPDEWKRRFAAIGTRILKEHFGG